MLMSNLSGLECTLWAGEESIVKYEEGKYRIFFKTDWEKVDHQIIGNELYFIRYCPIATGCMLYKYDAAGNKVFEAILNGVGDVSHSKYSNRVAFFIDKEKVIIIGNESHGRYYEERNGKDGSLIINKVIGN